MQNMRQAITQEAIEAIIRGKQAGNPINAARSLQVLLGTGGPALKQPTLNWNAADKYQEL